MEQQFLQVFRLAFTLLKVLIVFTIALGDDLSHVHSLIKTGIILAVVLAALAFFDPIVENSSSGEPHRTSSARGTRLLLEPDIRDRYKSLRHDSGGDGLLRHRRHHSPIACAACALLSP